MRRWGHGGSGATPYRLSLSLKLEALNATTGTHCRWLVPLRAVLLKPIVSGTVEIH